MMPPGIFSVRIRAVGLDAGPTSTQSHSMIAPLLSVATARDESVPCPSPSVRVMPADVRLNEIGSMTVNGRSAAKGSATTNEPVTLHTGGQEAPVGNVSNALPVYVYITPALARRAAGPVTKAASRNSSPKNDLNRLKLLITPSHFSAQALRPVVAETPSGLSPPMYSLIASKFSIFRTAWQYLL